MRQDITKQDDNFLTEEVFNTEELYLLRHEKDLITYLDQLYNYTPRQLEVLKENGFNMSIMVRILLIMIYLKLKDFLPL